jgi:hypothetical protein
LWIDHRQAVIVSLTEYAEKTMRVVSGMEKHVRFSGRARKTSAEDQRDVRFAGHLQKYYAKVIFCLRDADAILLLGPGEAKGEFRAVLVSAALGDRISAIEAADKMTDRQLTAKVRHFFSQQEAHA